MIVANHKCKFKKKWKIKKRNSGYTISFEIIRKQQKWIINGEQGQKSDIIFCYLWDSWCVFDKKCVEKKWKSYKRVCFWQEKKTNNIRGFLNKFSKNEQISPIGKADYLLMCSFKVCFLEIFVMLNVGQHYNLRNYLTWRIFIKFGSKSSFSIGVTLSIFIKFGSKSSFSIGVTLWIFIKFGSKSSFWIGVTLWIFIKFESKSSFFDMGNTMNFDHIWIKIELLDRGNPMNFHQNVEENRTFPKNVLKMLCFR